MRARFKHRPKRLSRRSEREKFDRMVMPAAYICLPLAVAILLAAVLSYLVYDAFPREIFVLGVAVLAIPGVLTVFRFVRGHYSKALNEP
jgi:hypothetical protein